MPDLHALAHLHNVTHRPSRIDHMVTVAQLRGELEGLPDDAFVILQKDGESNGYSPLAIGSMGDHVPAVDPVWYVPESTCAGEVYELGEDGFEPGPGVLFAVVLAPVN
jgi:hypothetical protein